MDTIIRKLAHIRYIPMIKTVGLDQVDALGAALLAGGLPAANISQQTDEGLDLLRLLAANFPDIVVGAGNVQTEGEARNAIEAGAQFIFSPLFDPGIIMLCQQLGVPVFPVTKDGILAVELELKFLGFYPVEKLGGLQAIDYLADRFGLKFIVAGGITESTVSKYLNNPHVIAVTGSWMIDPILVAAEQWTLVTKAIRKTATLQ
jgi:2-dehydro-3-deoxyphosphogluconate aldolase/(4S)-4-hydroxy-2-oxoglutarate aldolase